MVNTQRNHYEENILTTQMKGEISIIIHKWKFNDIIF